MSSKNNLTAAFAGESQANRKYLAFAEKAKAEGYPQIAKLFRAAASAETIHAHAHFRVMGGVKSTAENLQAAIDGESYEFKEMYPKFLKEAESENDKPASYTFRNAQDVEEIHYKLYSEALEMLKNGADLPSAEIWVCSVCGNTVYGKPPEKCPICGVPHQRFTKVE
jgi:rubrerythrin